jgi:hypothetical protein
MVVRREGRRGRSPVVSKLHVIRRMAEGDARAQEGVRRLLAPSSEQEGGRAGFVEGPVPCPYAGKCLRGREEGQRKMEWRISPGMCA